MYSANWTVSPTQLLLSINELHSMSGNLKRYIPGSPEYDMRRCDPNTLILSSSCFIFTMDRAATVSAATSTYPFPVIAT